MPMIGSFQRTVAAGDFMVWCIQHLGVIGGVQTSTYIEWYAENIGIVQLDWTGFAHGDMYELTGAYIVATEPSRATHHILLNRSMVTSKKAPPSPIRNSCEHFSSGKTEIDEPEYVLYCCLLLV